MKTKPLAFDHGKPLSLPDAHIKAVARKRRMLVQYDACDPKHLLGTDLDRLMEYRFNYIDEPGNQIDSIYWDIGAGNEAVWPSKVLAVNRSAHFKPWFDAGIDWIKRLLDEARMRGLESFWNHRISEIDGLSRKELAPEKAAHQEWVLRTWWWQGLWNLAVAELREYKVKILRELAERYDFDGFQIDFARHAPFLPVGQQWELRAHVTEFLKMVRIMLLDVARKRGRPIMLSAKICRNLQGCRVDGLDVETWMRLNLVDMLTLGSRSMDVDVEPFASLRQGKNIKLYPCLDDHHSTDGYRHPSIAFFRGVFGNWWQQGADGIMTFNWSCARTEIREKFGGGWYGPDSQRQAYHECGDPETLKGKDKIFAVERRGGYPYSEGFICRNDTAPLTVKLAYDGRPSTFDIRVCDDLAAESERLESVVLHVTLFDANPGDEIQVSLNGTALEGEYDFAWQDAQIYSPNPPPLSTDHGFKVEPGRKLLRLSCETPPELCRSGLNEVAVRGIKKAPHILHPIQVEKIEIHTRYRRSND